MKEVVYSLYVLRHPETREIRYVGLSKTLKSRYAMHIRNAGVVKSLSGNWIKGLLNKDLRPLMEVVFETPSYEYINRMEIATIKGLRKRGYRLTNISRGGKANKGWKHTEEAKEARRGRNSCRYGVPHTPEAKAKFHKSIMKFYETNESPLIGIKRSEETKRKMQAHQENPETRRYIDEKLWEKSLSKGKFPGTRKFSDGKWEASFRFKGEAILLGKFDSAEYAFEVYKEAKNFFHYGWGEVKW